MYQTVYYLCLNTRRKCGKPDIHLLSKQHYACTAMHIVRLSLNWCIISVCFTVMGNVLLCSCRLYPTMIRWHGSAIRSYRNLHRPTRPRLRSWCQSGMMRPGVSSCVFQRNPALLLSQGVFAKIAVTSVVYSASQPNQAAGLICTFIPHVMTFTQWSNQTLVTSHFWHSLH